MAIPSKNLFEDNQDIKFHIEKIIDWSSIVPLREQDFKDYKTYQETQDETFAFAPGNTEEAVDQYVSAMDNFGNICAEVIMKNAPEIDKDGPKFENGKVTFPETFMENVNVLRENGYMGIVLPRKYGGWQMPATVNAMAAEIITAADTGMATLLGTQDLGEVIHRFANEELQQKYIPKIASGEMGAAMLLTEPNFGSDLQNAQTKGAVVDGKVSVNGVKMWITHGPPHTEDGQVYLTVTRTVKKSDGNYKSGAAGLSLVLLESKDAEIVSLEKKLGIHSSPTAQLSFENAPGYLVGEEGKGLVEYTMALMNGARLGVAAQGVGVSERSYREAWEYANVREQFGTLIKNIPAVKRMLEEIQLSTEASRAIVYYTAYCVDMHEGYEHKLKEEGKSAKDIRKDENIIKWGKLAKVLTPFAKLFACDESNTNAYKALQIHGGVGYSQEYDISRIFRDARILTIYEGTSQLQVVAAIVGVTEGYSTENSTLRSHQKEIRDSLNLTAEMQPFLNKVVEAEKMITDILPFFKDQDKDFKSKYAEEIVWSATLIFISHLFLVMAAKDESGDKAKKAKHFITSTYSYTMKAINDIKLFAELEK